MKAEFLNVDPAHFAEVVFSDCDGDALKDFSKADGNNPLELRIDEGGFKGWHTFGGTYLTDNRLHGTKSLARYMTGVPYLTRVYFDVLSTDTKHPATVKYNKVWVMYERNDIQALSGKGSVLGVDMVTREEPAVFGFTIFNDAPEARTYRVTVMAGGNLAFTAASDTLRIYVDANANGVRNDGEDTQLTPADTVTLPAKTDMDLVAVHRPNWDSSYDTNERFGRRFAPAGITFQEVGRMRMTSYAIRTWLGTAEEVANKRALLDTMRYPSSDSVYATQAAWNQDKPDNPRLVCNTPDFRMALRKLAARRPARE